MQTHQGQDQDEKRLIAKHFDTRWGRADTWPKRTGVSVWRSLGICASLVRMANGFVTRSISPDELATALAYYHQNEAYIGARRLLNGA